MPNFPEWHLVPFGELLAKRLGCPVHVENDASAAAWGTYRHRGSSEEVLLTLGTGVGGGVVTNGQLLRGSTGCAAEIGHMYIGGVIESVDAGRQGVWRRGFPMGVLSRVLEPVVKIRRMEGLF